MTSVITRLAEKQDKIMLLRTVQGPEDIKHLFIKIEICYNS